MVQSSRSTLGSSAPWTSASPEYAYTGALSRDDGGATSPSRTKRCGAFIDAFVVGLTLFLGCVGIFLGSRRQSITGGQSNFLGLSEGDPPAPPTVDCGIPDDGRQLLFLTSSDWGDFVKDDAGLLEMKGFPDVLVAFRNLVLRLPSQAWPEGGEDKKDKANRVTDNELRHMNYQEPGLYGGLEVLVINDACLLKESFWNPENPMFNDKSGIVLNFENAGIVNGKDVVKPYLGKLESAWCDNFGTEQPGYFQWLGFDKDAIKQVCLWDILSSDEEKRGMLDLVVGKDPLPKKPNAESRADMQSDAAKKLQKMLDRADIVVVNGGNPDFLSYVMTTYAPDVLAKTLQRVKAGEVVWMGESAGSMVAGADMGLSYDAPPTFLQHLRNLDTSGLHLAGKCVIRPHVYRTRWSLISSVYGVLKHVNVVMLHNGNVLACAGKQCNVVGKDPPALLLNDNRVQRLAEVFSEESIKASDESHASEPK